MRITTTAEFGQALRTRRKELGYTQAFLSDFSGMSVSFLSELENGKNTAEIGKAIEIANILGLNIEIQTRS